MRSERHRTVRGGAAPSTRPAGEAPDVRSYDGRRADDWDDYVQRAPEGTFCHLTGWGNVVERTFGHRRHSLYAERGGAIVGVLPLFHVRSRLFGSMLVSSPGAIYGGALADDAETRRALLAEAKRLAIDLRVDYLELRDGPDSDAEPGDPDLRQKALYVTFERPIPDDEEALMRSYPKKIRYMIRSGLKRGLVSEVGRTERLDEFYDVYATNMRNLGTPVYPRRLFAELLDEFPGRCDILIVRQGRQVAGGTLNFYFRDAVLPHYGAAYARLHRTGVSNVMYWEVMRRAAARGYTRFDFGRSKRGSGSWAFKRGWRMAERTLLYRYLLLRAARVPDLSPVNPKFRLMIKAWKRLPVGVTKLIGPMVVKNIP